MIGRWNQWNQLRMTLSMSRVLISWVPPIRNIPKQFSFAYSYQEEKTSRYCCRWAPCAEEQTKKDHLRFFSSILSFGGKVFLHAIRFVIIFNHLEIVDPMGSLPAAVSIMIGWFPLWKNPILCKNREVMENTGRGGQKWVRWFSDFKSLASPFFGLHPGKFNIYKL